MNNGKPHLDDLANRWLDRIASARRTASSSQRSSRAGTPTGNPFGQQQQQQSMPSFQTAGQGGASFGGDFNFTAGGGSNPFAQQNGTPPPTNFQFGTTANEPSTQQNGGSGLFGNNNASFGSTFGSSNAQPQQNGFNPSTTSIFSNQNDTSKANASGFSFGQNNQSQSNGVTPSSNASFPTFASQNNDNPFKNFGQSQQLTQSTPSTSFGGFGQNSQQNGEKPPSSPSFGGFGKDKVQPQTNGAKSLFDKTEAPKQTTGSIFQSFNQQQGGNKTLFGSTSQAEETPKANTASMFSTQPQSTTSKSLFGTTPPPEQTTKPGDSVLSGLDPARASTIKPGMFTSGQSETPKPASNPFSFSQQNGIVSKENDTLKPSNLFSNLGQTPQPNGEHANMFGGNSTTSQQTPKPNTGLFNLAQSQRQGSSTSGFKFGQNQGEDASMTTPGNTPQKALFASAAPHTSNDGATATPSNQGKSLFERITRDPPATAEKPSFTPSTSMFATQPSATSSDNEQTSSAITPGRSLFDRTTHDDAPATAQKDTAFAPSTNLFNKPAEQAATTVTAAPWISHTPSAPAAPQTKITPPTPQASANANHTTSTSMSDSLPQSERDIFQKLNTGLREHLETQDPHVDWTSIMQYYLEEAANIRKKPQPAFDAPAPSTQTASAPAVSTRNMFGAQLISSTASSGAPSSNMFASATPKAPATNTANMFGPTAPKSPPPSSHAPNMFASQKTPKPSSALQKTFSQPPATAPVNKKRPAPFEEDDDDDSDRHPATEKRARQNEPINYPKLPENASDTAKLFQAALDKSTTSSEPPESSGFKPLPSAGGFTPSVSGTTAAAGMPSFSAPTASSGFMASFGKKAEAEQEKQRKKRKAADYDSDEESEEQWEMRDKDEQQAKRKKIEETAKSGSGFMLKGGANTPQESETPANAGKSLFERISKDPPATAPSKPSLFSSQAAGAEKPISNMFGSKTPAPKSSSNIFGNDRAAGNDDSTNSTAGHGVGDNTWKPTTPIKFGASATTAAESTTPAAPPPRFGNLFGSKPYASTSGSGSGLLNVPGVKPTIGFNFGGQPSSSLATSRATTPGVTTDGEGASTAGEGEDEEPPHTDPQVEDLTALLDEEKETEDVLFSVAMAKASKYDDKKDAESGEVKQSWVEKGKGPLYILKNKETGKVRVLLKIKPLGKPAMNFAVLPDTKFDLMGGKKTIISGPFVDHLAYSNAGRPSRWTMQVGKPEDADEIQKVLNGASVADKESE
jgi:hypothetical protein